MRKNRSILWALDERPIKMLQKLNIVKTFLSFEKISKEQITLNKCSINVTGRAFVYNFEKTRSLAKVLRMFLVH